jgi:ATP-binding cassette, subfamily C (CFTR/MRP), member 4
LQKTQEFYQEKVILNSNEPDEMICREEDEKVEVGLKSYKRLIKQTQIPGIHFILLFLYAINDISFSLFNRTLGLYDDDSQDKDNIFYYAGLCLLLYILLSLIKYMLTNYAIQRGNKNTYFQMVDALIQCPTLYFDKNPSGRILNRFTSDMGQLDGYLHFVVIDSIEGPLYFLNLLITIFIFNSYLVIPSLVQMVVLYLFYQYMSPVMLEIKKIDMLSRAPLQQFYTSTLSGIIPMRVYNRREDFRKRMSQYSTDAMRANMCFLASGRLFGTWV